MPEKKAFARLPGSVIPSNYNIKLKPNLEAFTFEGDETITVDVKSATNTILINSVEIAIQSATFQAQGSSDISTSEISFNDADEKVTFKFPAPLPVGIGELKIKFTGILNDKMKGFYRSKYTTPDGKEQFAAVTQFEATDARRAFPCWDEPAVKATFDVTLVVPKQKVALSNMPVISSTELDGDLVELKYGTTPIMSTYLLAFIVGDYDYVEGKDQDDVIVRVYTPVGKKEQGLFALEVAIKTLPFYKNYFGIAYPLPKMDLIAIADFSAGAMENWGLVTYRETALLVDPNNTSSHVRQWVALVVGHELAHQWFGNLVTMEWWTHLWLNEGFATWIEYLCVDHCFPEFDIWTQFVNNDLGRALELDALHTSHPIEVPVGHPSEVDEIFDAISYSKGASVIRMLHNYIGDEHFRKGMNLYLTKFKYKNAFTEDLWAALEESSKKPIGQLMSTWTKQMGFPVLQVEEKQDGKSRVVTITQSKFCADGIIPEGDNSQWMVPITICTASSPDKPVSTGVLDSKNLTLTLENVKATDWIKVNSGTVGVYRVQYSSESLERLIPAIKNKSLSPSDRLGLQSDLFALARAGMVSSVDVLKVAEAFINEDNYTVWNDLSSNLSSVALILQYTESYPQFQSFIRNLFRPISQTVGWDKKDGESPLIAMLRDLVLTKLGRNGDESVIKEATKRFEEHFTGSKLLAADLRKSVYISILSDGNEDVFTKMLELYDKADMQEEKVRISRSLGTVRDEGLISKVLDFSLSDKVRSQDSVFVIAGVTGSVKGRQLAWKFVKDNWTKLYDRYRGGFLLARLIKATTEDFISEELAKEIEEFFKANPAPAAERAIKQSCENIRLNARWLDRDGDKLKEWLKSK
ncbi:puromycin-sensitive aminopeptidase [Patella vulgata]|uniref:puromycin-sensitive aminopeptidase n=1 Tax=Patella vulgata TaxID=6465 RepID=UPI00218000A6|nr:puromycin-sensitive aminopeptidase [Patella vulgata]